MDEQDSAASAGHIALKWNQTGEAVWRSSCGRYAIVRMPLSAETTQSNVFVLRTVTLEQAQSDSESLGQFLSENAELHDAMGHAELDAYMRTTTTPADLAGPAAQLDTGADAGAATQTMGTEGRGTASAETLGHFVCPGTQGKNASVLALSRTASGEITAKVTGPAPAGVIGASSRAFKPIAFAKVTGAAVRGQSPTPFLHKTDRAREASAILRWRWNHSLV